MNKIYFILTLFFCTTFTLLAQQRIGSNEVKYIQNESTNLVQTLEELLNLIGDVRTLPEERKEYTEESYKIVIYDEAVYFEDDLIQERDKTRNVKVKDYLNNVFLFFKESGVSFKFENIRVSEVFEKDYLFVLVYFNRQLKGTSLYHNAEINNSVPRVAEVRLTKSESIWDMHIVNVRVPTQEDLAQSFKKATVFQSTKAFSEPSSSRIETLEKLLSDKNKEIEEREAKNSEWFRTRTDECYENLKSKEKEIENLKRNLTAKDIELEKEKKRARDILYENLQLEDQKGKFATLQQDKETLQKQAKTLKKEQTALQKELSQEIDQLQDKVNSLEQAIDQNLCYVTDGLTSASFVFENNTVILPYKRSKIKRLISAHSASSYLIEKVDTKISKFTIIDPLEFWKDCDKKIVIIVIDDDPEKAVMNN